jgi:periplasmic glucans biosynthesis protein
VRRLLWLGMLLISAVLGGSWSAIAQNQQPANQNPQAPSEQTQPAATPPGSVQTKPAATPPVRAPGAQGPPDQARPDQTPPQPQPQPPSPAPPQEPSKAEPRKSEGSKPQAGKAEGGRPEAGKSEGGKSEAGKSEGGRSSEAAKPEQGKSDQARSDQAKPEGAKAAHPKVARPGAGESAAGAGPSGSGKAAAGGAAAGTSGAGQSQSAPTRAPAAQQQQAEQPGAAGRPAPPRPQVAPRAPLPPFSFAAVERLAQDRASKAYRNRSTKLPEALSKLTYEEYRDIRFQRTSSLWYDKALFEVQFFHRGFNFDRRVNISEVSGGVARPVLYNPAMFDFGPRVPKVAFPPDLGFAGFRVHYPLNTPAYKDELIVFLGASYFRVLGRNQVYGASARGLAIDTGAASGEEFPYFTDFWLVKPEPTARTLTLYALLDSPGITGAYQFEVRPGTTTQVQVNAELFPRRQIAKLGIAPLTSMFLYGENSGVHRFDDYRPEVHDSDGLMLERGTGEWQWRPLVNPKELRVNRFMDEHPRGIGLVQRDRDFNHYQDNEARYERRTSYRVEPLGDWGKGGVELVEIPSDEEIHDNIVSFWVPETPVQPNKPLTFAYLLSAYTGTTQWPPGGKVIATHFARIVTGTTAVPGVRRVIVDFAGGDLDSLSGTQPVQAQASATGGEIDDVSVVRLAANGVWRVSMRMKTSDKPVDLRCYLTLYGEALTETWSYLWAPGV